MARSTLPPPPVRLGLNKKSNPSNITEHDMNTTSCIDNTIYCIGGIGGKGGTYERRLETVESLELGEDGRQASFMS